MKNFTDICVLQDDEILEWWFTIKISKLEVVNQSYRDCLQEEIISFHRKYIELSQRYRIGEVIPQTYLQRIGVSLADDYINYIQNYYKVDSVLRLFPHREEKYFSYKLWRNYFCSLHIVEENKEYFDYPFYDRKKEKFSFLIDVMQSNSKLNSVSFDFLTIFGGEVSVPTDKENNSRDFHELSFSLGTCSDIWFATVERNDKLIDSVEGDYVKTDNRYMAYRNTPRFNSYFRDLKKLFMRTFSEYDWDIESPRNWINKAFPLYEEGIKLDNRIIYQEDIDNGYVNMETYEWVGPARAKSD